MDLDSLSTGVGGRWEPHTLLEWVVPAGEQIEINELIKSEGTLRQTAH